MSPSDAAPSASSAATAKVMRAVRRDDTAPEVALRRRLHAAGLRYRLRVPLRVDEGRPIRPDVVFPRRRVAVFVDGCFWHWCPVHGSLPKANRTWWQDKLDRTVSRDRRDERRLTTAGWSVVRVWEHAVDDPEAVQAVRSALRCVTAPTLQVVV